jgi:uncharacterized protein
MPPTLTYPGVYIQELSSPVHSISGVATSIAAFVGYTKSGIDNRAQEIFSFSDFERLYGGLALNSELGYAVQQFFQNGGTDAYIVRTPAISAGAKAANVQFDTLTFTALSSGTAANGNLVVDVDYVGLTPSTDTKTFNVTITDLVGGTQEFFPAVTLDNTKSNFVRTVVNDPDNGSQLVNITGVGSTLPAQIDQTGITGAAITPGSVAVGLSGKQITGTVAVTQNNAAVVGSSTHFTTDLQVGQPVAVGGDATHTYQIQSITDDTHLTLTPVYAGTTASGVSLTVGGTQTTANFGLVISTTNPATVPTGLPVTVKISQGSSIPQSLAGIAAQLQQAINSVLAVQMPNATALVGVMPLPGGGQALRINALLPGNPDAVLSLAAPPSGTSDARASPASPARRCPTSLIMRSAPATPGPSRRARPPAPRAPACPRAPISSAIPPPSPASTPCSASTSSTC